MTNLKIIGHRGARGLAPENTIEGLKKALELGIDMIEFDVRVTSAGVPVLYHNRLPQDTSRLATLDEALKSIDGKMALYIEVKSGEPVEPIVKVLKNYRGKFYLASKNQPTLLLLHKLMPTVPKIVIESWSGIIATRRAKQVDTKILAMNQLWLWSGFITAMSRGGYQLYAYTLNNPAKAKRWAKFGLAGVVTDFPDRFR